MATGVCIVLRPRAHAGTHAGRATTMMGTHAHTPATGCCARYLRSLRDFPLRVRVYRRRIRYDVRNQLCRIDVQGTSNAPNRHLPRKFDEISWGGSLRVTQRSCPLPFFPTSLPHLRRGISGADEFASPGGIRWFSFRLPFNLRCEQFYNGGCGIK